MVPRAPTPKTPAVMVPGSDRSIMGLTTLSVMPGRRLGESTLSWAVAPPPPWVTNLMPATAILPRVWGREERDDKRPPPAAASASTLLSISALLVTPPDMEPGLKSHDIDFVSCMYLLILVQEKSDKILQKSRKIVCCTALTF